MLIDLANKKYLPVVDLNSEEFKQQEIPINFGIRKKRGPVRYEEEPSIGMVMGMNFLTGFMKYVTNNSNDCVEKRRLLEPNI